MSTDYDLICKDCSVGIHTIASSSIAYGDKMWATPENLTALRNFFFTHQNHHLMFVSENHDDALGDDDEDECEPSIGGESVKDVLENQQIFCEELRKRAPSHTYKNDREIVEGMRTILDLDMQIPSTDERMLIDLLRWNNVLGFQQELLKMVTAAYPKPSTDGQV